jgi:hypothetical protein
VDTEDIVKSQLYVRDEPRANNAFQRGSLQECRHRRADDRLLPRRRTPTSSAVQLGDPGAQCIFAKEQVSLETAWSVAAAPTRWSEYDLNVRYSIDAS